MKTSYGFARTDDWEGPFFAPDRVEAYEEYVNMAPSLLHPGKVLAQLVIAHNAPEKGTGWHRHEADFHIVIMLRGWARFMYEDQETLVNAGDCVHQRPGVRHYLFDYSPDMEYLEIVGPADFSSVDVPAVCAVPSAQGWGL